MGEEIFSKMAGSIKLAGLIVEPNLQREELANASAETCGSHIPQLNQGTIVK